jgi:acyl-CoA thioester hydrolase
VNGQDRKKIFLLDRIVGPEDIDSLQHVNNVVYLQWILDISQTHWEQLSNEQIRQKTAWVVLRHEIDYHRSARLGDRLQLKTWVGETAGFRSVRHVEILDDRGQKVVTCATTWCPIDPISFRPQRINKEMLDLLEPQG